MSVPTEDTKDLLTRGRDQALAGNYASALRWFQEALQIEAFDTRLLLHPQFLSHYGVALAVAGGRREEGRQLCERSLRLEPYEPEHYLNLGRLHFAAGDPTAALAAFELGLAAAGDHPDLLAARNGLDRRRLPPLSALPREHFLNRCLGKALSATGVRRPGG